MQEEVDFNVLAEKLSALDINNWDTHLGWDRNYYETRLGNEFYISLNVDCKGKPSNFNDKDYHLSVSSSTSDPIIFSGKEVRSLFNIIEDKYNNKPKVTEKKDKSVLVQNLNKFLQEK
jgi:hypothetical protein